MKIFCIGRNYADHAKELNNKVPTSPLVFMKPTTALLVNNDPFYYPDFSSDIHYEAEIVLKIGKNGRHIQEEFALDYISHIGFGIDMTARDLQSKLKEKGHPWEIAKGFDGSAPMSAFIPFLPEHHESIRFTLEKNGQEVQQGNTNNMIFPFAKLLIHLSKYFRLQMGDYIFTGTPAGVGPITIGDQFVGYIEGAKMLELEIR